MKDFAAKYSKGIGSIVGGVLMIASVAFGLDVDIEATTGALLLLINTLPVIWAPKNKES